jgi:hypothetical protein
MAMNGSMISSAQQTDAHGEYNVPATGLYVVTICYSNGTVVSRTILAQ